MLQNHKWHAWEYKPQGLQERAFIQQLKTEDTKSYCLGNLEIKIRNFLLNREGNILISFHYVIHLCSCLDDYTIWDGITPFVMIITKPQVWPSVILRRNFGYQKKILVLEKHYRRWDSKEAMLELIKLNIMNIILSQTNK